MKSFTKTTVETFTPKFIIPDYSEYDEQWIRIREGLLYKANKCFKCDKPFQIGDTIGLVALAKIGNRVFCQDCVKDIS